MAITILDIQPQSIVATSRDGRVFKRIYENSSGKNRLLTPLHPPSLKHSKDN
ncbi:MAG: hypothetical protein F6K23_38815 [Okeania sp. SIO2C9]|uniref:hypothetical protein n=1 Tax=Okeania sp. SIO2C9 TaxID=2607791 RepID=UPI0013BFDB0F|nr:hypothetical protein [Okeania sp. SIO2C9]NEQ78424.1 hypothetical protein [Okeania sp. SIO2C9]